MHDRPPFSRTFAAAIADDAQDRGWRAFLPIYIIGSAAVGGLFGWLVPTDFWTTDQWGVSATVFGGVLAFDGLLLALGWSTFSKIYEIILAEPIGPVLRKHGLLEGHLAFIDANHFVLVLAALCAGLAMLVTLLSAPLLLDRFLLGAMVATTAYSIVRALASIRMMNELIWERAHIGQQPSMAPVERAA